MRNLFCSSLETATKAIDVMAKVSEFFAEQGLK